VIRKNIRSWLETRAALRDFKEPSSTTEELLAFYACKAELVEDIISDNETLDYRFESRPVITPVDEASCGAEILAKSLIKVYFLEPF